jgi:hypothetical protein
MRLPVGSRSRYQQNVVQGSVNAQVEWHDSHEGPWQTILSIEYFESGSIIDSDNHLNLLVKYFKFTYPFWYIFYLFPTPVSLEAA